MDLKDKNLYYVGGVVRDEILNSPSIDIDFCYEGNAIEFAQNLNIIKTNPEFGTVRVLTENGEIDIASTRTETYPKVGHLPIINKIGCSLKEDLSRRDFTINALARNTLSGEITDHFNGLEDIKNKKLRVLHEKSFIDDPSRIIRGLKFAIRFNFELAEDTQKLQEKYLENINYDMSFHRIKKEIKETFNLNSQKALEIFINQGIYKLLGKAQNIPNIKTNIENLVKEFKPKHTWLVYAGLFNLSNFELTKEEAEIITQYQKIKNIIPQNDFESYNLFSNLPIESILLYAITAETDIALKYLRELSSIKISTSGNDLKELGLKEGKIYKDVFNSLIKEKLTHPNFTKQDELNFIKENFLS